MSLYGRINVGMPKEKEYFGNAIDLIKQYRAADAAAKEAKKEAEKDRMAQASKIVGGDGYEATQEVLGQMTNWLKENKGTATDEQWYTVLNNAAEYADKQGRFKTETIDTLAERMQTAGVIGADPDLERAGYYDGNSADVYLKGAENYSRRDLFGKVVIGDDGSIFTENGTPLFDTLSKDWLKPSLKEVPIEYPETWAKGHEIASGVDKKDVAKHIEDRILNDTSNRSKRHAIRWYRDTQGKTGENNDEIDDLVAIQKYAEEAAKYAITADKKEETADKNRRLKKENLIDGIQRGLSVEVDTAQGGESVQGNYAAFPGKNIYVGGNFDPDYVEGDEGKKYEVTGVYVTDNLQPVFELMTSKGTIHVASDYDDDLYKLIESQMTGEYGPKAMEELLTAMAP